MAPEHLQHAGETKKLTAAHKTITMNIGLFGGTFDPIHRGHIALATAAAATYQLGRVHFVPANVPPHKKDQSLTSYLHRYAMVALATASGKEFQPSLLEAPDAISTTRKAGGKKDAEPPPNYSLDTVRRFKQQLRKSDRLFFLIGIDAFSDIAKWHEAKALFGECDFIVASRPGYSLADVANALPEGLRPNAAITKPFQKQAAKGDLVLPGATVHLLEGVNQNISATAIREAARNGKPLAKFVDPAVADYVKKMGLYKNGA
jgi:nicotinate-nucleotide adenylyltransferase